MLDLNAFAKEVHAVAVEHGWWEGERDEPTLVSLMCCEVAEAMEEYRASRPMVWFECATSKLPCDADENECSCWDGEECCAGDRGSKPEGIAVELIDCCLRILDLAGARGWEMWQDRTFDAWRVADCERVEHLSMGELTVWLFYELSGLVVSGQVYQLDKLVRIVGSIAGWVEAQGVDYETVLRAKHEYNKTRSYRHGGKRC